MNPNEPFRLDRRAVIKWMLAAGAGAGLLDRPVRAAAESPAPSGYGADPNLSHAYQPGELWPLTFTRAQRRTAAALCEAVIPAEGASPGAGSLGVPDFIDEWISAPYPGHDHDRKVIGDGLAWLEAESQRRFGVAFPDLVYAQQAAICDDLCHEADAKTEFESAARFFKRFRDLTAGGYYTTPEGMKDLHYIGNVPLAACPEPPPELLQKLGIV